MNAAACASVAELFRDVFLSEQTGRLEVRSRGKLTAILFDRGLVAGDGESRGNGDHTAAVADAVKAAFSSDPESCRFTEEPPPSSDSASDLIKTVELFIHGVRNMASFEAIREALQARPNVLLLRQNPAVPLERLPLRPVHGFVLGRLGAGLSFADIVATIGPDDEDEAARFIFSLMLLGCVALDPPIGQGLMRTDLLLTNRQRDSAREEAEARFIQSTYAAMLGQNPYEILGITDAATAEEVRRAYDERRRAIAFERFLPRVRESMRQQLGIIEARLTEVYLAVQSRAPLRSAPAHAESQGLEAALLRRELVKTEAAATADEAVELGEGYYLKAKKYFTERDFHNCIQYCTQAIRQNDQEARYHFLLGEAQSRNPERRWQKMAENSYLQAVRLDPWSADYLVTLGQFYRKQGLGARARRQFERALELQPSHETARQELRTLP